MYLGNTRSSMSTPSKCAAHPAGCRDLLKSGIKMEELSVVSVYRIEFRSTRFAEEPVPFTFCTKRVCGIGAFITPVSKQCATHFAWEEKPGGTRAVLCDLNADRGKAKSDRALITFTALRAGGIVGSTGPRSTTYRRVIVGDASFRCMHFDAPARGDTVHIWYIPKRRNIL